MPNETYNLVLTKSQIDNLVEFYQFNFIESIRNDEEIDNIEYICDMCDVYRKLRECVRGADDA